jgi:hypothetical protein
MAHFRSVIQGNRGEASRCGARSSGMWASIASWSGSVYVNIRYDKDKELDIVEVSLSPHHGHGVSKVLYVGPVGEFLPVVLGGENVESHARELD